MRVNWFGRLSLLIEKYYIETFALEALIIFFLSPSLGFLERLVIVVVLTAVVAEGLKMLIREKRPKPARERSYYKKTFRLDLRSFPSAHAALAMAFVGLLWGSSAFFPVLVFGLVIAYSRVYIKSHYPHDVIAGGAIGFVIGYLVPFIF